MFRLALPLLALFTLVGCSAMSMDERTKPGVGTSAKTLTPFSKSCSEKECDFVVKVKVHPPSATDINCSNVTLAFVDGTRFDSLEIKKDNRVVLTFELDIQSVGVGPVFFGSNPVSLFGDKNGLKDGPAKDAAAKVDVVVNSSTKFTMTVKEKKSPEVFHFGVALGTEKGGCLADPKIVNGVD